MNLTSVDNSNAKEAVVVKVAKEVKQDNVVVVKTAKKANKVESKVAVKEVNRVEDKAVPSSVFNSQHSAPLVVKWARKVESKEDPFLWVN